MTTKLDNTLESGKVLRYHAAPTVQPQTDAHHQWNVAMLLLFITNNSCSRAAILEALMHDTGEYLGPGDVPFTAKRASSILKAEADHLEFRAREDTCILGHQTLTPEEGALVKLCDTLDGLVWCILHERRVGAVVRARWTKAFLEALIKFKDLLTEEQVSRAKDVYYHYTTLEAQAHG